MGAASGSVLYALVGFQRRAAQAAGRLPGPAPACAAATTCPSVGPCSPSRSWSVAPSCPPCCRPGVRLHRHYDSVDLPAHGADLPRHPGIPSECHAHGLVGPGRPHLGGGGGRLYPPHRLGSYRRTTGAMTAPAMVVAFGPWGLSVSRPPTVPGTARTSPTTPSLGRDPSLCCSPSAA